MLDALRIAAMPLLAVALPAALYWGLVFGRVALMRRRTPTARHGLAVAAPATGWPRVSIVVPVHNEERVIDDCVKSLRAQDVSDLEMIFVLDRCTDASREILERHAAEDDRVVIITNDACPDDWAGKCHAAHLGAQRATGQWLLFTDADTRFASGLVRSAVALAIEGRFELLSTLSTLTAAEPFEQVIQPVAAMNLMRLYPIERVNSQQRPFANGQFMLFDHERYSSVGGHAAVKDALLEDIAFARCIDHAGGRVGLILADGMLQCSMYDSLPAFCAGWKRIFIEACKRKPGRLRKNACRLLFTGIVIPGSQLALAGIAIAMAILGDPVWAAASMAVVLIGFAVQTWTLAIIYVMAGSSRRGALLYPLGAIVVARTMFQGASDLSHRRPIRWGGREYVLEPR